MTTEARLTTAAVARVLGISEQTVRYQVRIGAIPVASRTPGGHSRFVLEDVQRSLGIGLDAKLASSAEGEKLIHSVARAVSNLLVEGIRTKHARHAPTNETVCN